MTSWILGAILMGPIIYIMVILTSKSPASIAEYEYGNRSINPSDVLDSSIMYALQVAAIALFATWGHMYGFAAAIVPLFWLLGYFIFSCFLSSDFLKKFASDKRFRTLHDFLADHGSSKIVCIVAALLTLIGLSGPAMFEAFTVGRIIVAAAPTLGSFAGAGLALAFLMIALIYMTRGGFSGVVKLEQLQLAIGYGGFNFAFALALYLNASRIGKYHTVLISLICLICSMVFFLGKLRYHKKVVHYLNRFPSNKEAIQTRDLLGWVACFLGIISYFFVVLSQGVVSGGFDLADIDFRKIDLNIGFTIPALISLFFANAFYQFVDITQWQRLLSINSNEHDLESTAEIIRSNVLFGGVCSSLTWLIAIGFGVFLRHLYPNHDPYSVLFLYFSELSKSHLTIDGWLIFVFMASLVAVMFSTLDSLIAATAFTVRNDLLSGFGKYSGVMTIFLPKLSTVIVVIIQLALYLVISEIAAERVDAVLYICWSCQLAMLPIVLAMLRGRGGAPTSRVMAMVIGSIASAYPLIIGQPERTYEVSPWLAVIVSGLVLALCGGFRARK